MCDEAGWLILFTHDVSEQPSPYGCTPAMLAEALARIVDAGIEILPVKHAMAEVGFSEPEDVRAPVLAPQVQALRQGGFSDHPARS